MRPSRVTGTALDGTVEDVEATDRDFVLAVQWHAESLTARADHRRLFERFVEAAAATAVERRRAA